MRLRPALVSLAALFVSAFSANSWAGSTNAVAPAAAGQQALAVTVDNGTLVAKVCPSPTGCQASGGTSIDVPADAGPMLKQGATVETVKLVGGKHVIRVATDGSKGASFFAYIAAPLAGKGEVPIVLWSGLVGQSAGEYGEERVAVVREDKVGDAARVVIGELRNDVTICGRPAVVAAREIDPATLTLKRGASVQSLSEAERTSAVKLTAKLVTEAKAAPIVSLLRAQTASSAIGKAVGTLTDGDLETVWSENKSGVGVGEFAVMSSSTDVPISALEIVVRPPTNNPAAGVAPKKFYFATSDKLFEVNLPDDGWKKAGTRFEISLPNELTASCLSLVLDSAYAPATADAAQVTVAEVIARTPLDDKTPEALVEMLSGDRGKAAVALLERAGKSGAEAAMKAYDKLDDVGQRRAESVIDASACTVHAPFYVRIMGDRLATVGPALSKRMADLVLVHATDRVRRCGRASAPALAEIIKTTSSSVVKSLAAAEFALFAPAEAVPVLIDELATKDDNLRSAIRGALAQAAKYQRAWPVLATELERDRFSARTDVVRIEILRALGARIGKVTGARDALVSLWTPEAPFRTKYLLLKPAAELARTGDEWAQARLLAALRTDADPHIRLRAAEVSARVPTLQSALIEAVDDPEVRVRHAAVESLGTPDNEALSSLRVFKVESRSTPDNEAPPALRDVTDEPLASPPTPPSALLVAALERRLAKDPFTFVRVSAAQSLGQLPATSASDEALAFALKDKMPDVRARAVDGLALHRAKNQLPALRQISDSDEEVPEVRSRAILALGVLCDASRIDAWTKLSLLSVHGISDGERLVGAAAIAALGDVKPKDLAKRLAPLLDPKAPRNVREAAKAALEVQSQCK